MAARWLACVAAMALGLLIDTRGVPAALLASECGAPGGIWDMTWRHATLMPASGAAMLLAALAPWPRQRAPAAPFGTRVICALLMTVGMVLGARVGVMAAIPLHAPAFAGMALGMAAGMAAALAPASLFSGARR